MTTEDNQADATFVFQAEINQLLSLIINTFYSNKEVFLRELVSNASDACDKIRHMSLTDPEALTQGGDELYIRITPDEVSKTLTISDTGIGMTKAEMIKNLGTIAHSGTKAFMEALSSGASDAGSSLIGQFGMGFYAAFLVADKVQVFSKHNDENRANLWESTANGTFTISEACDVDIGRGTKIVLHLKDDQHEYLEDRTLRDILKRHSEFITYPIQLKVVDSAPKDAEEVAKDEDEEVEAVVAEYVTVNENKPIWMRTDATAEEHISFYKSTFADWGSYAAQKQFTAEGNVSFRSLLYVPQQAPMDLFDPSRKKKNIKLYVRRVFITDDCDNIIPEWLGFIKGIVDSEDLPLNISREILQKSKVVDVIRKTIVKKSIEMIRDLANDDKENYTQFYENYGKNLKWGITEDPKNQTKLADLLRFKTNVSGDEYVSLSEYVARMKEGQSGIYYVTGDSYEGLKSSVFTEAMQSKGFETIFMIDPMDEYMMQGFKTFDDKPFQCASKVDVSVGEEGTFTEDEKKAHEDICNKIKDMLCKDDLRSVSQVKVSTRLVESPCVIVTDVYGWTANMERLMRAQALRNNSSGIGPAKANRILEVNITHPLITKLCEYIASSYPHDKSNEAADMLSLLYDTALLHSGFALDNPSEFANKVHSMMTNATTNPIDALD